MICVPITAKTLVGALKEISLCSYADIIELRLDFISHVSPSSLGSLLDNIRKSGKKSMVTVRKQSEGGYFSGSEETRLELLIAATELGADFVDIELSSGASTIKKLIDTKRKSKIIVSYHNFSKMPWNISWIYQSIKRTGCDIIKIASFARSINDNLVMFSLINRAKKDRKKIIAICMGEKGEISRVLGVALGGFLTFASSSLGKESAPGQIEARVLREVYHIGKIHNPKIYGLVGNPVSKSKGYILHNNSFFDKGINAIYVNFLVDNVSEFIRRFKGFFSGVSVTMPFKERVVMSLDQIDPVSKKIGAINTVVKSGASLKGYNTDYIGAIKAISERVNIKGKKVVIVGAGGVAKAIAFGVIQEGGTVYVTDINVKKAKSLAKNTGAIYFDSGNLSELDIDVLVNATPVGMYPNVNRSPVDSGVFKEGMVVFDCIYNPVFTKMLNDAKKKGCKIISGLELFINQGAAQFELWTGKSAPYDLMKKVLTK